MKTKLELHVEATRLMFRFPEMVYGWFEQGQRIWDEHSYMGNLDRGSFAELYMQLKAQDFLDNENNKKER